jgi:hypothetical protein
VKVIIFLCFLVCDVNLFDMNLFNVFTIDFKTKLATAKQYFESFKVSLLEVILFSLKMKSQLILLLNTS